MTVWRWESDYPVQPIWKRACVQQVLHVLWTTTYQGSYQHWSTGFIKPQTTSRRAQGRFHGRGWPNYRGWRAYQEKQENTHLAIFSYAIQIHPSLFSSIRFNGLIIYSIFSTL